MRRISLVLLATAAISGQARAQGLNEEIQNAIKAAAKKVSPSVVQIDTTGGSDMVVTSPKGPVFRKALGPTTGVIVSEDGYVISSAFNFINNPTTILVSVPGKTEPYVAKRIANDKSRMLALLKIEEKGLAVPAFVPAKDIFEGHWAIALGRSLEIKRDQPPSISVGIISARSRIWGKAFQTDCKISPVNYGGPIVDIIGRVQGIIVPASPKGDDETAGFEWYDSGIGFAIPMEDVMANLSRLKLGKDLKKGLLGVRMKSPDIYGVEPVVGEIVKDSAAALAGLKPGDVIVEVDGHPVVRMAQIQHILGPRYEGDRISLKYRRDKTVVEIKELELVGQTTVVAHPFLGILPMRDDPALGVEIRYVFPKSPAEKIGLQPGDRIVKFGSDKDLQGFTGEKPGRAQFFDFLNTLRPGSAIKIEVKRKGGKVDTLDTTLAHLPGAAMMDEGVIPEKLPTVSTLKKALEPLENTLGIKPPKKDKVEEPKIETGLLKRNTPDGEHKYFLYIPDDYDPNISYGVLVWLHPPGKNKEADLEAFVELWATCCSEQHMIIVAPLSENDAGWIPSEAEYVVAATRDVLAKYTIDRQRVVSHGLTIGGQMAIHLGFQHRDLFKGVITTGSVIGTVKDNIANQRLAFYMAGGDLDPIIKSIADSRVKLVDKKYPAFYREIPNRGRIYFEEAQLREIFRWIDSLDRQ